MHATRKDPEWEWLGRDNLESNPITIKWDGGPRGRAVLLGFLILLLSTLTHPFPTPSCFVSTCVSSNSTFQSVRQEPTLKSLLQRNQSQRYQKTQFSSLWVSSQEMQRRQRLGEKIYILLVTSKMNIRNHSQSSISLNSKIGAVLS